MMDIINSLVGLPWKKGGRDLNGFDCWGFFKWFYATQLDIHIADDYDYLPGDTKKIVMAFAQATESGGDWVKIAEPVEYCAVALSMNRKIHHVGVWLDGGCLHAVEGLGVVYNSLKQLKRNGYTKVEYYTCQQDPL